MNFRGLRITQTQQKAKKCKAIVLTVFMGLLPLLGHGATFTATQSGNWNNAATWGGSGYPQANDNVNIGGAYTVTVTTNATCAAITFTGNGATLTVNSAVTLTVNYGSIKLNSSAGNSYANTITGSGTITCASLTVGTDITPTSDRSTTLTTSIANLFISGNLSLYSNNNGSSQNNAIMNLSSGIVTVNGSITSTNEDTGQNTSTLTMASGTQNGTLNLGGGTPFSLGAGTNTIRLNGTGSTVNYNQAWGQQAIYSGSQYTNLIAGNSSNSQTASGNLTVSGTLTTTAGGGLNMGTYTLSVGVVNNSGTIETQNTSSTPFNSGLTWGGTVLINGSSSQTIPASTFNNLIITNGNGVSLGGNITVNGKLTLNGGQLTLGSRNLTLGETSPAVAGYNMTVITNGTGSLRKIFTSPDSYVFPVADAAGTMSYLTLNFASGTFAAGAYASVQVVNAKEPNLGTTTNYLNKYWTIGQSGITGFSSTVTGNYRSWADIVPANTESNLSAAEYTNSSWIYYSGLSSNTLTATGVTSFGNFTGMAACSYNSTVLGGVSTYTPVIDMPSKIQTLSTTFTSGQYFVMNVIKGLTYEVYTTSTPSAPLKITVYEEGNPTGSAIASSITNSGNPGSTNANNVYLSFTSPLSGQVRVMLSLQSDCSSKAATGLTLKTNVSGGSNTQDDPTAAGTNTWIGQVYDGTSFNNYIGNYNVVSLSGKPDEFQETFGTGGAWPNNNSDDASGFNINSNSVVRAQELEQTYSVHYRMNSSKRGFYTVSMASDDGVRLTVDNTKVYEDWTAHSPKVDNSQLISLSGSSSLLLDYYEQNGQNVIGFYNLTQIFSNALTTNTSQTLCKSTTGIVISGDAIGTLPTGITLVGYQWYYSTTPTGTRTLISGATSATYIPTSSSAPFNNVTGNYYLYRVTTLRSTLNVGITNPTNMTNESNAATIRVKSCPNYWIGSTNATTGTSWQTAANWSDGIPGDGDNISFAAVGNSGNNGNDALNDLVLDNYYTVGDMTNNSSKKLIIPVSTGLTVNGSILTNDAVGDKIYIKSEPEKINGTLIFHNPSTSSVKATIEMYSKATINTSGPTDYQYFWQYFGVPVTTVTADPTLYGAYVRRAYEPGTDGDPYYWTELTNADPLYKFIGHEICQTAPTVYTFKGQLVNTDFDSGLLAYTSTAKYPGEHLFANSYTAAINVDKIEFGSDMDKTVFLYNTGSYGQWNTAGYQTSSGDNPGQYLSIPQNVAGFGGVPGEVPSMSSMLVKTGAYSAQSYIKFKYSDVATKNTTQQRIKSVDGITNTDLISTRIDLTGQHYSDRMWIFTEPSCTRNFDNGWDGRKMLGSSLAPQIYAIEPDGDYQVNSVSDMHDTDIAFQAGDEVEYTLTFTHENIQRQYAGVYLVDLVENKTVDITQSGSKYTFETDQSDAPAKRFKILTRPYEKGAPDKEAQVRIFTAPGRVFVHNLSKFSGQCTIYDIAGRAIKIASFTPNAVTEIINNLSQGAYVVNTVTNGEKIGKRVIVQ